MVGRVRVIIQARMGSSRLPGKVKALLAGHPLLEQVVRRLQSAARRGSVADSLPWEVTIATTTSPVDNAIVQLCRDLAVGCFRGPEEDVLARYVAAAEDLAGDDTVVRATADNPLYCPERSAAIITRHLRGRNDYTCIENLSYVVPEVMQVAALRRMALLASDQYCREHVTPFFRQGVNEFRVEQLPSTWRGLRPEIRLTVDTPEELRRMNRLFASAGGGDSLFSLEQAYAASEQANSGKPTGLPLEPATFYRNRETRAQPA
jgi:spore coat polysaccharide biosynthesis protein SpsF